jgi:hypothetical protein
MNIRHEAKKENKTVKYNPSLTDEEMMELAALGMVITDSLLVNLNNEGVPGFTDRMEAVKSMVKYLEIHDYVIWERTK